MDQLEKYSDSISSGDKNACILIKVILQGKMSNYSPAEKQTKEKTDKETFEHAITWLK